MLAQYDISTQYLNFNTVQGFDNLSESIQLDAMLHLTNDYLKLMSLSGRSRSEKAHRSQLEKLQKQLLADYLAITGRSWGRRLPIGLKEQELTRAIVFYGDRVDIPVDCYGVRQEIGLH